MKFELFDSLYRYTKLNFFFLKYILKIIDFNIFHVFWKISHFSEYYWFIFSNKNSYFNKFYVLN